MKPFLFLISIVLFGCSGATDQPPDCPYIDKEFPLHLQLKVLKTSDKEVTVLFNLRNDSSATAILYKPLLPLKQLLTENIFSIFDTVDYDIVPPTFKSQEDHCGGFWSKKTGLILPKLTVDNFIFLKPHDSIVSIVNLFDNYDFSDAKKKGKKYFELSPRITFPLVNKTMQHLSDWDTNYYKYEPIYFDVGLPIKQDVDSMRIQFRIP